MPSNLNVHKQWHVKSSKNRQIVYEAEQKKLAEEKRIEEIRKRLQTEAEMDDLRKAQEPHGLSSINSAERLEWLYANGWAITKQIESMILPNKKSPLLNEGKHELEGLYIVDPTKEEWETEEWGKSVLHAVENDIIFRNKLRKLAENAYDTKKGMGNVDIESLKQAVDDWETSHVKRKSEQSNVDTEHKSLKLKHKHKHKHIHRHYHHNQE